VRNPTLRELRIDNCTLADESLLELRSAIARLTQLSLTRNRYTIAGLAAFIATLNGAPLRELVIECDGYPTARQVQPIVDALIAAPRSLATVVWHDCPANPKQRAKIAATRSLVAT
jgi:hypothetical protein